MVAYVYINRDGKISTKSEIFAKKREGKRRYDIHSRSFNPVTMKFEEVRIYQLSTKVRSKIAADKAVIEAEKTTPRFLSWINTTKESVNRKAADNGVDIIWIAA